MNILHIWTYTDKINIRIILRDRKSTRLNSSHANISYAVFCLKKKLPSFANRNLTYRGRPLGSAQGNADSADRKSTRLNSSHANISYAAFCLKNKIAPSSISTH